jgi:hypothetical protein
MAAREAAASLNTVLARVPIPRHPKRARAALTQGMSPHAFPTPAGFALAHAGRASQPHSRTLRPTASPAGLYFEDRCKHPHGPHILRVSFYFAFMN